MSHDPSKLGINSKCVHAGLKKHVNNPVVTPIYQTSTFSFDSARHGAEIFSGEREGYIYTRMANPTIEGMEDAIAVLEGGYKSLGCGSGMAAVHTIFAAYLSAGEHIVCGESVYGPTTTLLKNYMVNHGIESTFVDSGSFEETVGAFKENTKLLHLETPTNPTLVVADIQRLADACHERGILLCVDNTFYGPILQRPFEHGADIVMHSLTKSLNGHADVVGGVIVAKNAEMYGMLRKALNHLGGVIDPFNAFLVHRGIRTLSLRVMRMQENAIRIAEWLKAHPKVEWVAFPGFEDHPGYAITKKQADGPGSMITFGLKGGLEAGRALMDNVKLITLAVSLGGVESLIQHPASMTHAGMSPEARAQAHIGDGLVRFSVGIEDVEDLIGDLEHALQKA